MNLIKASKGIVKESRGTYNIGFDTDDETQFTVHNLEELKDLWDEFCRDNEIDPNNIDYVEEVEMDIRICPICGGEVEKEDMRMTKDCQGIPYRLVCSDCYDEIMEVGYDGERYDETDECIDYDY